jgi:hypothetical protein
MWLKVNANQFQYQSLLFSFLAADEADKNSERSTKHFTVVFHLLTLFRLLFFIHNFPKLFGNIAEKVFVSKRRRESFPSTIQ